MTLSDGLIPFQVGGRCACGVMAIHLEGNAGPDGLIANGVQNVLNRTLRLAALDALQYAK